MRLSSYVAWLVLCLPAALTGCAFGPAALPTPEAGPAISGILHGGRQPVVGAQVYLFAANTTGYGNASVSLLTSKPGSTSLDSGGGNTNGDYFVTTDAGGNFSITGDYSCTSGQQVYLYASGGNPGAGINSGATFLAILGNCTGGTSAFATTTPNVVMNEVSTIAAAYAFAGFATDPTHVSSSGTPLAQTGIANAFAASSNLASISSGQALLVTPGGNGTVPQTEINTLANILAACVNTNGPASSSCSTLFTNAKNGSTPPSDTATAAINIAHNPGANVSALLALQSTTPPFLPKLPSSTAQNDWTIGLYFNGSDLNTASAIAIDASGDLWIPNTGPFSVADSNFKTDLVRFNHLGVPVTGSPGYTGGGLVPVINGGSDPGMPAIDTAGNVWILGVGSTYNSIAKFSPSGTTISPSVGYSGAGVNKPTYMAFDATGNLWISNRNFSSPTNNLSKFDSSGNPISSYTGGGLNAPSQIAFDNSGILWVANEGGGSKGTGCISKFNTSGTALSPTLGITDSSLSLSGGLAFDNSGSMWVLNGAPGSLSKFDSTATIVASGFTGGGQITFPNNFVIDGTGNLWIGNTTNIVELNSSGTALSPSTGFIGPTNSTYPGGLLALPIVVIDGSGNLWSTTGYSYIVELVGVASPVITPTSVATANHTVGNRP